MLEIMRECGPCTNHNSFMLSSLHQFKSKYTQMASYYRSANAEQKFISIQENFFEMSPSKECEKNQVLTTAHGKGQNR